MNQPKLSIIITCYNLGQYLQEAVVSIKEFENTSKYEIILVNDGSTDLLTLNYIENVLNQNSEIVYLNQSNLGLAKARNNGIKIANGKYIIPLDTDNKLRPCMIEQTISILDRHPEIDVVYGNVQTFGESSGQWIVKPLIFPDVLLNNYIDACAGFRKSTWEQFGGYDEEMPVMGFEDWDLWLRMANRGCQFKYVNEFFFDYRVRQSSMLSDAWSKRQVLLDYIFSKKELKHLGVFRELAIENQLLKQEPAFNQIFKILLKKIKRKISF